MSLEDIIVALDKKFQFLSPNEKVENPFYLEANESLIVGFESDETDSFYIFCNVAPMPKKEVEKVLKRLLEAQLFDLETEGASFGWSSDSDEIILHQKFSQEIAIDQFIPLLETFMSVALFWREQIEQGKIDSNG